ncbi:cupin domain-containing protein [Streptomyces sp. NPDC004539]|uniref:cupin domain-containing protein n=1 Tax=Streptomyces sp. NPDC004539 TaxID=3154280 RepID=UPI0033A85311
MIISTTAEAVRVPWPTTGAEAAWSCLVRRGMLHSECEAVEHWTLPAGAVLAATPEHGVEEALLVLEGEPVLVTDSGEHVLRAGRLVLVPHGCRARLLTDRGPARLITVRALAASVSDRLPPRVPELAAS